MTRALLLFLMVLVAWPTVAAARPTRVVIGQVQGDDDGEVGTAIKASISSDVAVVGKREVTKAADKLKLSEELTDKEIKKLIKEVDADAVVKGSLDKAGDTMALHLKLYLKAGGKPKAFTLSFSNAASDKFRATLRKTILAKLGVVEGPDAGAGDDATEEAAPVKPQGSKKPKKPVADAGDDSGDSGDDAAPKKPKKPVADAGDDSGDDVAPKPKKHKKPKKPAADGDDAGAGDGSDDDDDTEVVVPKPAGHSANRDAIRVDAGVSVTSRTLTFASRVFPQAPKPYKNGAVPGARIEAEIYPLAFGDPNGIASGLGLAFMYDKTLSLTLKSTDANNNVVSASANQQIYSFGPRFRIVFGKKVTSPSLTLAVDYGTRSFVVARGMLTDPNVIDIPDIQYTAFQPGLALRIPFAPAVAFVLDARAVLVTDAGPIQLNTQYGQAKVTGGEARAGLDIVIGNRFAVQIVGEYAQFGFAFVGNGAMSNARDGDASSPDVGGAADRYLGGAITLAGIY